MDELRLVSIFALTIFPQAVKDYKLRCAAHTDTTRSESKEDSASQKAESPPKEKPAAPATSRNSALPPEEAKEKWQEKEAGDEKEEGEENKKSPAAESSPPAKPAPPIAVSVRLPKEENKQLTLSQSVVAKPAASPIKDAAVSAPFSVVDATTTSVKVVSLSKRDSVVLPPQFLHVDSKDGKNAPAQLRP